jgi:methionyl aminopeptidase
MISSIIPKIPIKKSSAAIEVYKNNGPIFGSILYQLYQDLKKKPFNGFLIEEKFKEKCHEHLGSGIRFPFAHQKNYLEENFIRAICVSVNDQVVHCRANEKTFNEGDVVSIDCGVSLPFSLARRINFDSAFTITIGEEQDWVSQPHIALKEIIQQQPKDTMEIASIIRDTARQSHLKQVVSMAGHGIGHELHESPTIYNAPGEFLPVKLFEGMCFCVEPIFVNPGNDNDGSFISPTCIGPDGWEISTVSGDPTSHFETMFGVIDGQIVDLVGVTNWVL